MKKARNSSLTMYTWCAMLRVLCLSVRAFFERNSYQTRDTRNNSNMLRVFSSIFFVKQGVSYLPAWYLSSENKVLRKHRPIQETKATATCSRIMCIISAKMKGLLTYECVAIYVFDLYSMFSLILGNLTAAVSQE